jgi:nucleoside 2-deoxyribosyltransferase
MTVDPPRVYLAAPFFSPRQLAVVEAIEAVLDRLGFPYYSPRRDGVLVDLSPAERRAAAARIFDANVLNIKQADLIVAVIDDRDVGVAWEIGYAYGLARRPALVTFTAAGHGVNVMLQQCADSHVRGVAELADVLTTLRFEDHRNFDERVY